MKNLCVYTYSIWWVTIAFATPKVKGDWNLVTNVVTQLKIDMATRVIEQLIENLRLAAKDASDMIAKFTSAVQNEALQIEQQMVNDIQGFRDRVSEAIDSVTNRLIDSGVAVVGCIATHRDNATAVFDETMGKAMSCVENQLTEIREQIEGLGELANDAMELANFSMNEMRKCTEEHEGHFISTGTCLGRIALETEGKTLMYGTQMTIAIGQINLSMVTLPASLQVCAGSRLVESSMTTARIIMEIGNCSASSVYNALVGPYPYTSTIAPLTNEPATFTETPAL
ncbi:hypothetical protein K1T71_005474 [Dendrolimus kikuchii]|uniref:Uncharacterized protein n=1 Tax=Dendrolimus kikuchii TaxID=765133 RepID=A0ACC1D448_9NEOP|nr:hypothetical protein K1T71_005474 [Dendrolimus kikuchii]